MKQGWQHPQGFSGGDANKRKAPESTAAAAAAAGPAASAAAAVSAAVAKINADKMARAVADAKEKSKRRTASIFAGSNIPGRRVVENSD
jgi:hypothetical protein